MKAIGTRRFRETDCPDGLKFIPDPTRNLEHPFKAHTRCRIEIERDVVGGGWRRDPGKPGILGDGRELRHATTTSSSSRR